MAGVITPLDGQDGGLCAKAQTGRRSNLRGSDAKYIAYNEARLAVVEAAGGWPHIRTEVLDRRISDPHFAADGNTKVFLYTDDPARHIGRI